MKLLKATKENETKLSEWLTNKNDCLFVTGKESYCSQDYYDWLSAPDQHCYFLLNEGDYTIVGYGEIWIDETEHDIELAHLIIDPLARNKGYGKILIQLLEKKAKEIPYPNIYMRVRPENNRAISCYQRIGYVIDEQLNRMFEGKWVWLKKQNHY